MRALRALTTLLVAAGLLLPAGAQARSLYFGISADSRSRGTVAQSRAAATGVRRLREDLEWWRLEPIDGTWSWASADALYRTAAERGMTILPILNGPPCWAVRAGTPSAECPELFPVSAQDYADFAAHVADRYGPWGSFWKSNPDLDGSLASRYFEIWNEPYWGTGSEPVNPAKYAALYVAAVKAGRAANAGTRYLIESTVDGQGGVHWAEALQAAEPGIGTYIDGLAVHPYPGPHEVSWVPQTGTDEAFKNVKFDYQRWWRLGVNRPVWITEVGYSSCADGGVHCVTGVTQAERESRKAALLSQLLSLVAGDEYGFVHALYLYNLEQWSPASEPDADKSAWFGLLYGPSGERLPAWAPFAAAVSEYNGPPVPKVTITGQTLSPTSAKFTFKSTDTTAGFECQLDESAWTVCSNPKTYGVGAGAHTFKVRARNALATSPPATYRWSQ